MKPGDQVYYPQQIQAVSRPAFLAWRYSLPQVAGCLFPEQNGHPLDARHGRFFGSQR